MVNVSVPYLCSCSAWLQALVHWIFGLLASEGWQLHHHDSLTKSGPAPGAKCFENMNHVKNTSYFLSQQQSGVLLHICTWWSQF